MRILVALEAVDGRKGIDSLVQLCREKLAGRPFSGCVFVFRGAAARFQSGSWPTTGKGSGSRKTNRLHTTPLPVLAQRIDNLHPNLLLDAPTDPIDCNASPAESVREAHRVAIHGCCRGVL